MKFHRLLYRSELSLVGATDEILERVEEIAHAAAERNERDGITGCLVLSRRAVLQVLEGPSAPVEATFERICCDQRHRNLTLLEFTPAAERTFGEWAMKFLETDHEVVRLLQMTPQTSSSLDAPSPVLALQVMRSLAVATLHGADGKPVLHPVPA